MDFLASLDVDTLPEQQTRINSTKISEALQMDPDLRLGFDACCACGSCDVSIVCKGCQRVRYCSRHCRRIDSIPTSDEEAGHSSIICALLRLCNDDDSAEETSLRGNPATAAQERIQSEYESYPATLANILLDGPHCYRELLKNKSSLTIHVVGATNDSELWGQTNDSLHSSANKFADKDLTTNVVDAYADAFTDLAIQHKLGTVTIVFVGPGCPKTNLKEVRSIPNNGQDGGKAAEQSSFKQRKSTAFKIYIETHCSEYNAKYLRTTLPNADVVVFFNPGFTCLNYQWDDALKCCTTVPFLIATNTEMEGIADCQYMYERGHIRQLPTMVSKILNPDSVKNEVTNNNMFFSENPYAGSRVRQSGNMANDLFVKNRWIFGGRFTSKKRATSENCAKGLVSDLEDGRGSKKVAKTSSHKEIGPGNTKRKNPALI